MRSSNAGWLASLPEPARKSLAAALSPAEARALLYDWSFWARPAQLPPPGNWRVWLLLAGRGFGKTRTGAELIRERVATSTARRLALVAPTAADARNVMVEGESGILAISPPWDRPRYEPSKRRLTWPNGAVATLYSADEPERLRGPQHDATWCDELGSWRYPEAWDMLMFGLRLGPDPRVVVTTTPRPTRLIRALIADPTAVVTRGSTYENRANLAPAFLDQIIRKYEGTRLGRQEIEAELLDDVPGALWTRGIIEAARATASPTLIRVVVAIDPAATSTADADETGIIVAGRDDQGRAWVLADASGRYQPTEWAKTAIAAYRGAPRRPGRCRGQPRRRDGRSDLACNRSERALHSRARLTRQGCPSRAGGRTLRAGPGSPHRCLPTARRSDVRLCACRLRRCRLALSAILARPGRRPGVGIDRSPARADARPGDLRPLSPARSEPPPLVAQSLRKETID